MLNHKKMTCDQIEYADVFLNTYFYVLLRDLCFWEPDCFRNIRRNLDEIDALPKKNTHIPGLPIAI